MRFTIKNNWRNFRRKPGLFYRMKRHEYLNRFTNSVRLRTIDISVTSRCNFRCRHCYAYDLLNEEIIPLPMMANAIRELLNMGVYHFVLQGGEAITDMERLAALVKMACPQQSYINVVSNGYGLSTEVISELKAMGVDKITVSLDSGIAGEHDHNRNMPGSFERALSALERITAQGMHTSFSTTITHENLYTEGINALFELSETRRYRMDIQVAAPVGRWEGRDDLIIDKRDAKYIFDKVNLNKRNWNHQTLINRDVYPRAGRKGCPAVKEFMSITSKGELLPCTFIHTSFGNIADRSIKEMRAEALTIDWFNHYHPTCLCGEEKAFIDTCIRQTYGKKAPVAAHKIYSR